MPKTTNCIIKIEDTLVNEGYSRNFVIFGQNLYYINDSESSKCSCTRNGHLCCCVRMAVADIAK